MCAALHQPLVARLHPEVPPLLPVPPVCRHLRRAPDPTDSAAQRHRAAPPTTPAAPSPQEYVAPGRPAVPLETGIVLHERTYLPRRHQVRSFVGSGWELRPRGQARVCPRPQSRSAGSRRKPRAASRRARGGKRRTSASYPSACGRAATARVAACHRITREGANHVAEKVVCKLPLLVIQKIHDPHRIRRGN